LVFGAASWWACWLLVAYCLFNSPVAVPGSGVFKPQSSVCASPHPLEFLEAQQLANYFDPSTDQWVAEWPAPANRKQLQRFLGFTNFYRKFIMNNNTITKLTPSSVKFSWSQEADKAFNRLKSCFVPAPILNH